MKTKLITVYDPSVLISEISVHYQKSLKYGKINQRKIRTEKLRPLAFFVDIARKDGITHSMECRRVHAALREKFGTEFPTLRRNSDGSYRIAQEERVEFVAILENGTRISGSNSDKLSKRAAHIAIAQSSRVVEIATVAVAA